jgi:hypothetical protein
MMKKLVGYYLRIIDLCNGVFTIKNENEEYSAFLEFYSILFNNINGKNNLELTELCAFASVKDYTKYSFYDDVEESIKKLNCKYEIGIISDAWPLNHDP